MCSIRPRGDARATGHREPRTLAVTQVRAQRAAVGSCRRPMSAYSAIEATPANTVTVSSIEDVLERLRADVVAQLGAVPVRIPPDAALPRGWSAALRAWFRLRHRSVPTAPRSVIYSNELRARVVPTDVRGALARIEAECVAGDDLTHRLTRQFYKSDFNDFLFNNFRIHHLHLGVAGAASDATQQHAMCSGRAELLFAVIERDAIYFLDVFDHEVFESAARTKDLLRIAVKNWPDLLPDAGSRVVGVDLDFESAYKLAKAGFTTIFDVDGVFLLSGGNVLDGAVRNGRRASCTTSEVVDAANSILNRVVTFVRNVTAVRDELAREIAARSGANHQHLELEIVSVDRFVTAKEVRSGVLIQHDGSQFVCLTDGRLSPLEPTGGT